VWLKWVQYVEGEADEYGRTGNEACLLGDYVAVVGDVDFRPYVVLLDRADGRVVKEWMSRSAGWFSGCVSIGGKLYVVGCEWGKGIIYVFDSGLNAQARMGRIDESKYTSIASDGVSLYISGSVMHGSSSHWFIEKRDLNGELLAMIRPDTSYDVELNDMNINPATGTLWAVGGCRRNFKNSTFVAILDRSLREISRIIYPEGHKGYIDYAWSLCFDDRGHAYVGGMKGIAKFNSRGELVAVNREYEESVKIACIGDYIYAFTYTYDPVEDLYKRILAVLDNNLETIDRYMLSRDIKTQSYFTKGRPAFDGSIIYVAGWDGTRSESRTPTFGNIFGIKRIAVYAMQVVT